MEGLCSICESCTDALRIDVFVGDTAGYTGQSAYDIFSIEHRF